MSSNSPGSPLKAEITSTNLVRATNSSQALRGLFSISGRTPPSEGTIATVGLVSDMGHGAALQELGELTGFGITNLDFDNTGDVKTVTEVSVGQLRTRAQHP